MPVRGGGYEGFFGHFFAIECDPKVSLNVNTVFDDPKQFDDPKVPDILKEISNGSVDFNDPKEFDDPQIFDDPKEISTGSMDFDNPKIYDDTSIIDGLVLNAVNFEILPVSVKFFMATISWKVFEYSDKLQTYLMHLKVSIVSFCAIFS